MMIQKSFKRDIKPLQGEIIVPPDKSISHRSVILGSLCTNRFRIINFLWAEDCLNTVKILNSLGADITFTDDNSLKISGKGFYGFKDPVEILDAGNSGTALRLLSGLIVGIKRYAVLTGDESLIKRPVDRIIAPLTQMGAKCFARENNKYPPLTIIPSDLNPIRYELPVPSAQVKSAIAIAALLINGTTEIIEPIASRNHTELMLQAMGAHISTRDKTLFITGHGDLSSDDIIIPGDISSAAFLIVAALIVRGSEITIKNVGVNPTRSGILTILKAMGGYIELSNHRTCVGEQIADITVKHSMLRGTTIEGDIIPLLIDEIPIIAVAASVAEGMTVIKDAAELRKKESDRLYTISCELQKAGADIVETPDGLVIQGKDYLPGGTTCISHKDHRIAMSLIIASLVSRDPIVVQDPEWINTSFPGFEDQLRRLTHETL